MSSQPSTHDSQIFFVKTEVAVAEEMNHGSTEPETLPSAEVNTQHVPRLLKRKRSASTGEIFGEPCNKRLDMARRNENEKLVLFNRKLAFENQQFRRQNEVLKKTLNLQIHVERNKQLTNLEAKIVKLLDEKASCGKVIDHQKQAIRTLMLRKEEEMKSVLKVLDNYRDQKNAVQAEKDELDRNLTLAKQEARELKIQAMQFDVQKKVMEQTFCERLLVVSQELSVAQKRIRQLSGQESTSTFQTLPPIEPKQFLNGNLHGLLHSLKYMRTIGQ